MMEAPAIKETTRPRTKLGKGIDPTPDEVMLLQISV
jgi:hypothetical protein